MPLKSYLLSMFDCIFACIHKNVHSHMYNIPTYPSDLIQLCTRMYVVDDVITLPLVREMDRKMRKSLLVKTPIQPSHKKTHRQ